MKTHWDRASHFIGIESCRFGMTDVVNGYIISTVGDYRPFEGVPRDDGTPELARLNKSLDELLKEQRKFGSINEEGMHIIGWNRFFETMVFADSGRRCESPECGCGGIPIPKNPMELDSAGYKTADEARAGHAKMVAKYMALTAAVAPS